MAGWHSSQWPPARCDAKRSVGPGLASLRAFFGGRASRDDDEEEEEEEEEEPAVPPARISFDRVTPCRVCRSAADRASTSAPTSAMEPAT